MWEIYAYQNADSLFGIFNAAAAIHGSGDYMAAVAAVAFCGFTAALVAYAFAPEKLQGWKWLATVLLVFSARHQDPHVSRRGHAGGSGRAVESPAGGRVRGG